MRKRKTIAEARFPVTKEFGELAKAWAVDAGRSILGFVWLGCDLLLKEIIQPIDVSLSSDDLERSITQLLEPCIRRVMTGNEPFCLQHGTYEHETRRPAPAQPPQYDIAFIWNANPRIVWPVEAKVLQTESDVSPYISEVKENYLTCRYAPFSGVGAMLGYLVMGNAESALDNIRAKGGFNMTSFSSATSRPHRVSRHVRSVPPGTFWVKNFQCHHLILELDGSRD